mgnify:CR=1 FL=1
MTVLTKAINTSKWKPAWNADMKIKNLEKNPANGGIPASENRDRVITNANFGLVLYCLLYTSDAADEL